MIPSVEPAAYVAYTVCVVSELSVVSMVAAVVFVVIVVLVGVVKSLDVSLVVVILVDKDGFREAAETVFLAWLQFVVFVTHSTLISVPITNQV